MVGRYLISTKDMSWIDYMDIGLACQRPAEAIVKFVPNDPDDPVGLRSIVSDLDNNRALMALYFCGI